ncbi:ATP-dependent nuclease [Shewanella gelidii]|uniref:Chromosome segregation protein SMC n=1 Tax=Shewanella gelidii TaxID=1642821 RepID=A0A917JQE5_9GAMM|nr:AAA family ATPase [Shewanella gelidii]MCL1097825.1 AAA family ATPase [Shewanella gelidii]GGI78444.1 chromosome segregation protein SMC [Shewanella gelidii]
MKLSFIRLSNFQSFGPEPTTLTLDDVTYLIGPNGSGKTAALLALSRMFAFNPAMRRVQRSDFHVPSREEETPEERTLWLEAEFSFPELREDIDSSTVAPHFGHMRLDITDGLPRVRYRLTATMGIDGDIEESFDYVLEVNPDDSPLSCAKVPRGERNHIHVHYLPARRDPADHVAYGSNAILGRMLRAIQWKDERETISRLAGEITNSLVGNPSIMALSHGLTTTWNKLHKGNFFTDPKVTFVASEVEALLRHTSISFGPGHDEGFVDFTRLSDGQKSMLYLSLVLSSQMVNKATLSGTDKSFDVEKLKPPVFTIVALEEPENSLSPHYLGRIVNALKEMTNSGDAQALIATHAPSMLRRVKPEDIRYLRLCTSRNTQVKHVQMPPTTDEAHKFVRQAVQAFPEIYFSRLVVLGEGDSEEIVLPRLLTAKGIPVDESAITVAPLGGRHVNHFWRLLSALEIPYITLLDLDIARYQGGWGRMKYVNDQLAAFNPSNVLPAGHIIPSWSDTTHMVRDYGHYRSALEERGIYFSFPMDLDFAMLLAYPDAYGVLKEDPEESTIKAVLGKSHFNSEQYAADERRLFNTYHQLFKLGSKPASHIEAFAKLSDADILRNIPESINRLARVVKERLEAIPE